MAKEIKFNIKLLIDDKEQLVTASTSAKSCSVGAFLARLVHLRQVHPLSLPPFASAVRSDSVRRPIRFRSQSDQIPFAVGGKVLGKTLQERCAQRQYYRRLRHLLRERISLFLLSAP